MVICFFQQYSAHEGILKMDACPVSRQLPPIIPQFHRTSVFPTAIVRCNLLPKTPNSSQLSIGDRKMFMLGMGYVGQFFAADLKDKGWFVSGSCTSTTKKTKLEELGYQAYVFDANNPQIETLEIVKNHTHLLVSIPPIAGLGDPMFYHKGLMERVLTGGKLQWLVYLSSTSVYGDCGGAWVDEGHPANPASEHARARLAAEEKWLSFGHSLGIAAQVFRLGGIYGPGRSAVDTILKQEAPSESQKMRVSKTFTARVHVADVCQALHASISEASPGTTYNIVDDDPAPRVEVFALAKKLVEEKLPGSGEGNPSPENAESLVTGKVSSGEKRVSNARMKKELGVELIHPTYRSGLRSIMEQIGQNSSG